MGRVSDKDQYHFINFAYASLMDVLSQVDITTDLEYITKDEYLQVEELVDEIGKMLSSLRTKRNS